MTAVLHDHGAIDRDLHRREGDRGLRHVDEERRGVDAGRIDDLSTLVRTVRPFETDRLGVAADAQDDLFLGQKLAADALDPRDLDLVGVEGSQLGLALGEDGRTVGGRARAGRFGGGAGRGSGTSRGLRDPPPAGGRAAARRPDRPPPAPGPFRSSISERTGRRDPAAPSRRPRLRRARTEPRPPPGPTNGASSGWGGSASAGRGSGGPRVTWIASSRAGSVLRRSRGRASVPGQGREPAPHPAGPGLLHHRHESDLPNRPTVWPAHRPAPWPRACTGHNSRPPGRERVREWSQRPSQPGRSPVPTERRPVIVEQPELHRAESQPQACQDPRPQRVGASFALNMASCSPPWGSSLQPARPTSRLS